MQKSNTPCDMFVGKKVILTKDQIQTRVKELAAEIDDSVRNMETVPLVIGTLKGSFMFFSDLVRNIESDIEVDFVRISTYGNETVSSNKVLNYTPPEVSLEDRHVLIVEEIVDTGRSMQFLKHQFNLQGPSSISFATLLSKPSKLEVPITLDYVGFEIPDDFVLGYGMDHRGIGRQIPEIFKLV